MAQRDTIFGSRARYRLFTAIKYLTYALLCLNVYLFLQEEMASLEYTFTQGLELGQLIQVFAATIDTAAWVILLLLFELETSVLDDSRIHGGVRLALHGVRGLCSVAIVYAFTGYWAEMATLYQNSPLPTADACSLLGQHWSVLVGLDDYAPLDAGNCAALGPELFRLTGFDILASGEQLRSAQWLAWTDVINAGAWILVVVVLEVEVRLQLRGNLSDRVVNATKYLKFGVYFTLFAAAAYWGVAGDFLDFWDAALWLFAFIFIELNVFEWQYETAAEHEEGTGVPAPAEGGRA
jgi:hypothetical protein